jgi:hypothetical protein
MSIIEVFMKKNIFLPLKLIAVFMLMVGFACALSGGDNGNNTQEFQYLIVTSTPEAGLPLSTVSPEVNEIDPQLQTWLVLFYFNADDPILEEDIYFDLNEVEMVGSSDRVHMVAQIDRYKGAFDGDGDWTSTRRYYLTKDNDLNVINSDMVEDLGELDMGDSNTLVDFATWAIQNYPADRVVLIMSDHGSGWPGGWSDTNPSNTNGNWITLPQLEYALNEVIETTGIHQFELVGMDACLMSMLEVYNSLAPFSHYAVASQENEPALGWAYEYFLKKLVENPAMSGADLSQAIVEGYIDGDQRILNDAARQKMLSNYGISDQISADQLAEEWSTTITLTAADLTALPKLNSALGNFLSILKGVDQSKVAEARSYSQSFFNVFDERHPSPYIDLGNFAESIASITEDQVVIQSNQQLQAALADVVIAEKHGDQRPGASGISVFFPVSNLYWDNNLGVSFYTLSSRSLVNHTLWDDFLAFHYSGQDFVTVGSVVEPTAEIEGTAVAELTTEPSPAQEPGQGTGYVAPGASQVTIAPITLSERVITPEGFVKIQTDISGDNIAYVYLVGLMKSNTQDKYLAYYVDYLQMGDARGEQNGVIFPVWERSDGKIHIEFDWNLAANAVCDNFTCVFALVNPDKYTTKIEDLLYYVEGWYVFGDTGERIEAFMYFYNKGENLIRTIVANPVGNGSVVTPSEIIPKTGDQFLTVNTVLTFNDSGKFVGEYQEGNVLTFGETPLYYGSFGTPDPGNYLVGIMVMDMDGNKTWRFAPVTVSSSDYEVTPEDFPFEDQQQSQFQANDPEPDQGSADTSGPGPQNTEELSDFDAAWQSRQARIIRSIFIPLAGALIGLVLVLIIKKGDSKNYPQSYLPSSPQTPQPSDYPYHPPELKTKPPELQTSPPPLMTTPPPINNQRKKGV